MDEQNGIETIRTKRATKYDSNTLIEQTEVIMGIWYNIILIKGKKLELIQEIEIPKMQIVVLSEIEKRIK